MIHGAKDEGDVVVLTSSSSLLEKVGLGASARPTSGCPTCSPPDLTPADQNQRLRECIEPHLFIYKDGRKLPIVVIPPMLEFLSDLFYERVQQAILWKPRGGGGSLAAAILIWLMMVYRQKSFIDMAGSGEQAKRVYEYTTQFWYCVPGLADAMLAKDPLQSETALKNGVTLTCVPASARRPPAAGTSPGSWPTRSCQEDPRVGKILHAAIQSVLSRARTSRSSCSRPSTSPSASSRSPGTWPRSAGTASTGGTSTTAWRACAVGLEEATADDPQALNYCRDPSAR